MQHYAALLSVASVTFVAISSYTSYTRHINHSFDQMLGAITLVMCMVVIFGFSRLSAVSTSLIAGSGALVSLLALWLHRDINVARLSAVTFHLCIIGICCFVLRKSIEDREWDLFTLAKENLHTATAATKNIELRSRLDLPADGTSRILADEVKLSRMPSSSRARGSWSCRCSFKC